MTKKLLFFLLWIAAFVNVGYAQKANEGKAVVSKGFENSDSIRFGMLRPYDVGCWIGLPLVDAYIDSLGVNAVENFEADIAPSKAFYGHQKVYCGMGRLASCFDTGNEAFGPDLNMFGRTVFQRIYMPFAVPNEQAFRYNDSMFNPAVKVYNNTYDSEDISPYEEFPANPGFVDSTFHTLRYNNVDSVVYYGNEGRVILGYSDDRNANDLLTTPTGYPFQTRPGLDDTAKAFSVNLEFWLDTTTSNIDMANASTSNTDSVPLVRVQVLYKKAGQSVLPFVPFTNGSDTNHGWYKCLDTVVTRAIYRNLNNDWRAPDSVFTGTVGHKAHTWNFKQLHAMITLSDNMMARLAISVSSPSKAYDQFNTVLMHNYGWSSTNASVLDDSFSNPDSIVAFASPNKADPTIEIRVLSTYRTTVRVRDLTYQDTMVDRYLYRKIVDTTKDSTHSLEQNGAIGGNDSLMDSTLASWNSLLGSNLPREVMYNDIALPGAGCPAMGYLDYIGSKYEIFLHMRPQDDGDWSLEWRRARMSFDGQQPSIFENQINRYGANYLPLDYVYYGLKSSTASLWGSSHFDTTMGLIIARKGTDTDTLKAYHQFELWEAAQSNAFNFIRAMNRVALWHPWSKRFATEYSIKSFSYVSNGAYDSVTKDSTFLPRCGGLSDDSIYYRGYYDSSYSEWVIPKTYVTDKPHNTGYSTPPLTPEMITTLVYGSFACGSTAVSAAESFGNSGDDWASHALGPFTSAPHTDSCNLAFARIHDYNIGHYYTCRQWPSNGSYESDMDGPLPNYYLGISNTYKAYQRSIARMNAIWASGNHPMKNFRWLDSYSQYGATDPTRNFPFIASGQVGLDDSIARWNAFLKVVRTVGVNPWKRNSDSSYMDLPLSDSDRDTAVYCEVGLFIDSISTSQRNYAAMVINPRCWPDRDTVDVNYYNNGLDSISKMKPTLGDIDVRKVYLKLDLTKTDPTFSNHIYYVVRDLWHPDSTWLVNKDSTFAVYIKPGDAKFLYFEPGIAVNVAARSGTDTGVTSAPEFCFNNGRRVAEIEGHTHDVVCYTRNNHLYVAYPAAGYTFGGSPDASSGDNIITGYEQALDTTHTCARPSIAVAMNDTGVAISYWYKDGFGNGHIATAYRKAPDSAWNIVELNPSSVYPDPTSDYSQVTPTITPINDTSWLIAAGWHPSGGMGHIFGLFLMTPKTGSPYGGSSLATLASDIIRSDHSIALALFPTLASRRMSHSGWNVHMAWQIDSIAGVHQIYFTRFDSLPNNLGLIEAPVNVSKDLDACDNIHPALAIGGTYEFAGWLIPWTLPSLKVAYDSFYHDELAWESTVLWEPPSGGALYRPVLRARHEGFSPISYPGLWGAYNVFNTPGENHYPEPSAEDRRWDYKYASPSDTSHDWVRLLYQNGSQLNAECWAPNWYHFILNENGYEPSVPQSTGDFGPWPDNGCVDRSICWTATGTNPYVRITNGYMPRIKRKFAFPNVTITAGNLGCDTLVAVGYAPPVLVPPLPAPRVTVNWNPASPSLGGPSPAWHNPEDIPNVMTTNVFTVSACDSIFVPRSTITTGLTIIQDSLRSGSDYVMVRLLLRHAVDSAWFGTVDSMIVTPDSIHWPGVTPGIEADTARYMVSCGASTDSVFLAMDVERGDTTNSIERAYVMVMDTDTTTQPAEKHSTQQTIHTDISPLALHVYPNPAKSTTRICVEALPGGYPATVEVVNELGDRVALLYDDTPQGDIGFCMNFDCSALPSGNYYVHVQDAIMGTSARLSIVK